jgi:hypothetical protein
MVAVPTALVPEVIEFIERQDERPNHGAQVSPPDGALIHEWDEELLKRAYLESPREMRDVFDYLASRPDEAVDFDQTAEAIGAKHGVRTLTGHLSGFARRLKRYGPDGQEHFPWDYHKASDGRGRMTMPAAVAEVIRDAASS